MSKKIVNVENFRDIYYDNKQFQIEYIKSERKVIVRRKSDNIWLGSLENVSYISQVDEENFLILAYSQNKCNACLKHIRIENNSFKQISEMKTMKDTPSSSKLTDSSFIVLDPQYGQYIYNTSYGKSGYFNKIIKNCELEEIFGQPIVFVENIVHSGMNYEVQDTLQYGINPENFEIITHIYSEMQERFIEIYSKDQILSSEKLSRKCYAGRANQLDFRVTLTRAEEIEKYLELLDKFLKKTEKIEIDHQDNQINYNFVKKFVR